MEHISPEYAIRLHENGLKPYSQFVIVRGKPFRQINVICKEAYEKVLLPLLSSDFDRFELKHGEHIIKIKDKISLRKAMISLLNNTI